MSKLKELEAALKQLSEAAQLVADKISIVEGILKEEFVTILEKEETHEEKSVETEVKREEKKAVTLEEVRGVLAGLSRNGYTSEVKELLKKYGAERLSEVSPEQYEALLAEAEVLKNAG